MKKCQVIDTGKGLAATNMQLDQNLLRNLAPFQDPTLHLYDWEQDSATYGYFIKPEDFFNLESIERQNFHIARRPTGGGIIFHTWDLAFSLVMPNSHPCYSKRPIDNYHWVNKKVIQAIQLFTKGSKRASLQPGSKPSSHPSFCMATPTIYDVIIDGCKVAGAAQRNTSKGFLHQGSIFLAPPCEKRLKDLLKPNDDLIKAIFETSYALIEEEAELQRARQEMKQALIEVFTQED